MNPGSTLLSRKSVTPIGAIGYLSLNYNEVKCLEMVLYFLTEQLNGIPAHLIFTKLREYHVRNLSHWLNNANLKSSLRFDSKNSVMWPVVSLEDANWLVLALEVGIPEDTIISMAADDAHYERDMAMMYAETDEDYGLADEAFSHRYCAFQQYYGQIAQLECALLAKLRQILNDERI